MCLKVVNKLKEMSFFKAFVFFLTLHLISFGYADDLINCGDINSLMSSRPKLVRENKEKKWTLRKKLNWANKKLEEMKAFAKENPDKKDFPFDFPDQIESQLRELLIWLWKKRESNGQEIFDGLDVLRAGKPLKLKERSSRETGLLTRKSKNTSPYFTNSNDLLNINLASVKEYEIKTFQPQSSPHRFGAIGHISLEGQSSQSEFVAVRRFGGSRADCQNYPLEITFAPVKKLKKKEKAKKIRFYACTRNNNHSEEIDREFFLYRVAELFGPTYNSQRTSFNIERFSKDDGKISSEKVEANGFIIEGKKTMIRSYGGISIDGIKAGDKYLLKNPGKGVETLSMFKNEDIKLISKLIKDYVDPYAIFHIFFINGLFSDIDIPNLQKNTRLALDEGRKVHPIIYDFDCGPLVFSKGLKLNESVEYGRKICPFYEVDLFMDLVKYGFTREQGLKIIDGYLKKWPNLIRLIENATFLSEATRENYKIYFADAKKRLLEVRQKVESELKLK